MSTTQRKRPRPDDPADSHAIVVVGGDAARAIATNLDESATVRFVSDDETVVRRAADAGLDAHRARVTAAGALRPVAEGADTALVAFDPDRTALLTAQLLRTCCGVDTVFVCVSNETYREAFEPTDVLLVDEPSLLAGAVRERLSPPDRH